MTKVVVRSFAISIDGYGAGKAQDLQNPLGVRGPELMEWFFPTRVWRKMQGHGDGETGVDNGMAEQGFEGIGAWAAERDLVQRPGDQQGQWSFLVADQLLEGAIKAKTGLHADRDYIQRVGK